MEQLRAYDRAQQEMQRFEIGEGSNPVTEKGEEMLIDKEEEQEQSDRDKEEEDAFYSPSVEEGESKETSEEMKDFEGVKRGTTTGWEMVIIGAECGPEDSMSHH